MSDGRKTHFTPTKGYVPPRPTLTPWTICQVGIVTYGRPTRRYVEVHRSDGSRVLKMGIRQLDEAEAIVAAVNASSSGTEQCYWIKDGDRCQLDWGHSGRHESD